MPQAHRAKKPPGADAATLAALSQLARKGAYAAPMDAPPGASGAFGVFSLRRYGLARRRGPAGRHSCPSVPPRLAGGRGADGPLSPHTRWGRRAAPCQERAGGLRQNAHRATGAAGETRRQAPAGGRAPRAGEPARVAAAAQGQGRPALDHRAAVQRRRAAGGRLLARADERRASRRTGLLRPPADTCGGRHPAPASISRTTSWPRARGCIGRSPRSAPSLPASSSMCAATMSAWSRPGRARAGRSGPPRSCCSSRSRGSPGTTVCWRWSRRLARGACAIGAMTDYRPTIDAWRG